MNEIRLAMLLAGMLLSAGVCAADDDDLLDMAPVIFADNRHYASEFDSQSVPTAMNYGNWYAVTVAFRNTGTKPWRPGEVRLINASRDDFGVSEVALSQEIGPDAIASFSFNVKYDCKRWVYVPIPICSDSQPNFSWVMAGPNGEFGPASPVKSGLIGSGDSDSGGGALPGRPNPAMVDLEIPGVPPPKDLPARYRAPQRWSEIQ